jgi:hypothetical protein
MPNIDTSAMPPGEAVLTMPNAANEPTDDTTITAGLPALAAPPDLPIVQQQPQPQPSAPAQQQSQQPDTRSFSEKLASATNRNSALPEAHGVGGWAKSLLGGVVDALGDAAAANATPLPNGAGWLAGAERAMAARSQRINQQQQEQKQNARQDAVAMSEIDKNKVLTAHANAQMIHEQALNHQVGEAAINASIVTGKSAVENLTSSPSPAPILQKDIDSDKLQQLIADKKIDPAVNTAFATGRKQTGENTDGTPIYRTTYTVVGDSPEVKVSDAMAARMTKYSGSKIPPGTILSGAQYNWMVQQSANSESATIARNKTLVDNELASDKDVQRLEVVSLGPDWNKALAAAGNDPLKSLAQMQSSPALAAKYPTLFQSVRSAYGEKEFDQLISDREKKAASAAKDQAEINLKIAQTKEANAVAGLKSSETNERNQLNPTGASGLQGEAYLASLPGDQQNVIKAIGEGRETRSPRQLQDKNGNPTPLALAIHRAYPDYDDKNAAAYGKVVQDFKSGPTSRTLTAYGTAMNHVRRMYDSATALSLIPGTDDNRNYNQDITYVSTELAKALNPTGVATESAIAEQERAFHAFTPHGRRLALENAENILTGKLAEVRQRWANAQVRPSYQPPMPGLSQEAIDAAAYVRNHGQQTQQPQPQSQQTQPQTQPAGKVHMQKPDGTFIYVPAANQAAAEKLGAKVAQ